ncbi:FG-GAP-like repeat-containing protein [Roseateles sp.]|uniref:FG-GAP-like repeat-containing protein n=1 Tax=Roseateles sp. TaxID=1971397 RepID=UPI0039EA2591
MDYFYTARSMNWGSVKYCRDGSCNFNSFSNSGDEWNLARITYGGRSASPVQPHAYTVDFAYEDRPDGVGDRSEAYVAGYKLLTIQRLKTITVTANTAPSLPVKSVNLVYGSGPITSRSVLGSIKECAGSSATLCQPPVSFNYSPGSLTFATNAGLGKDHNGVSNGLDTLPLLADGKGVITGDFNGDGLTDILRWADNPAENVLYLSEGNGNFRKVLPGSGAGQFNITDQNLLWTYRAPWPWIGNGRKDLCFQTVAADFNGDGKADLLRFAAPAAVQVSDSNGTTAVSCPGDKTTYLYLSNGDGSFTRSVVRNAANQVALSLARTEGLTNSSVAGWRQGYQNFVVGDFNNDGKLDILALRASTAYYEADVAQPGLYCSSSQPCSTELWLGVGDGTFTKTTPTFFGPVSTDSGAFHWGPYLNGYWVPYVPVGGLMAGDMNGDGVLDISVGRHIYTQNDGTASLANGGYYTGNRDGSWGSHAVKSMPCSGTMGDMNGDGVQDMVCDSMPYFGVNMPEGFFVFGNSSMGAYGYSIAGLPAGGGWVDVDGDGKVDVLVNWARSLGDGSTTSFTTPNNLSSLALYGAPNYLVGNFSGSGAVEFLRTSYSSATSGYVNTLWVKADPTPPDLLTRVTSGSGAVTDINYANLGSSARYASDQGTANASALPIKDMSFNFPVVVRLSSDSGVGTAKVINEFGYAGAKVDLGGRGFLGFREIRQQMDAPDGTSKLTSVRQMLQQYPYIGSTAVSETYLGPLSAMTAPQTGTRLSRVENTYCDTYAAAGAQNSASVTAPCPVTSKLQRPYVYKSVQTGMDLAGYATPTVTTTQAYSGGYLSNVLVQTQGVGPAGTENFSKQTSYEYFADDISADNWKVGRVQKSTTSSTVPNSLSAISTTAGSQPKASATTGQ